MRFLARVFLRCVSTFLLITFLLQLFTPVVSAQMQQSTAPDVAQSYAKPNFADNVDVNQHTYVQAMFLELLIAIQCQLTGIDITNPTKSCLGFDLTTGKLGYAPPEAYKNGQQPIGGVMGMLNHSISSMYVPSFGTNDYIRYVASDFGIVKPALAAPYNGFQGLSPIIGLWKATRDIAYYLLIIAFIFIGIGVMLRLKIDPRTVMTVQNQIPRVIICIILITFSYAIAGLGIDTMWAVTYMGVNKITSVSQFSDPQIQAHCEGRTPSSLSSMATANILETPFVFVNKIFIAPECSVASGILDLSWDVGNAISGLELDLFRQLLGLDSCELSGSGAASGAATGALVGTIVLPVIGTAIGALIGAGVGSGATCYIADAITGIFSWFIYLMWFIIVVIIVIITLFRIWFELLKAYVMVILYVVLGPLWIVFGLLPKRPLGFEKWLRVYFANLAVFPATVFILVGARVLAETFNNSADTVFVPPLVGNPNSGYLGSIIEFGMLLMAPQLMSIIREKLGTPPLKQFGQAMQTFNAGRRAPGAVAKKAWAGLYRHNPTTGAPESALAMGVHRVTTGIKKGLIGQGGLLGYKGNNPADANLFQRWGMSTVERAENKAAGHYGVTNDQRYGIDTKDRVKSQRRLAGLIGTDGAPTRQLTDAEWDEVETIRQKGFMTGTQQRGLTDHILKKPVGQRSSVEQSFLEEQADNKTLTPTQRLQFKQEQAQAGAQATAQAGQPGTAGQPGAAGQPGTVHVILTVQPRGGGAAQTIHMTPGQSISNFVMNMTAGTTQAQQANVQRNLQGLASVTGMDITSPVTGPLSQQHQAALHSFVQGHISSGHLSVPPTPRTGGQGTASTP